MSKLQKILLSAFLAGILLCGIGTGVALIEYSSLTYEGTKKLGEDMMVTKDFDYEIEGNADGTLLLKLDRYTAHYISQGTKITEDPMVPAGTVRYRITYNEDLVSPELTFVPYENKSKPDTGETGANDGVTLDTGNENSESDISETAVNDDAATDPEKYRGKTKENEINNPIYIGELHLDFWTSGGEFDVVMKNKDMILNNLKHGKIASYEITHVNNVEIMANPETIARINATW